MTLTTDQKRMIAEYMGWYKPHPDERMDQMFWGHFEINHPLDLNDAGDVVSKLCDNESDWYDFYDYTMKKYDFNLAKWLFNPDNFWPALAQWLERRKSNG